MSRSAHPPIAAAASWMEQLHMPMREAYRKYTKSELSIMAWRSGEVSYNMQADSGSHTDDNDAADHDSTSTKSKLKLVRDNTSYDPNDDLLEEVGRRLGPDIVNNCEDENGQIDLRKLTGPQALKFMNVTGLDLGRV